MRHFAWEHIVGGLGLVLLIAGHWAGLFWAPPERMMGDVGRAKLEGDIPGDIGLRRAKPGESTEDVGESEGEER